MACSSFTECIPENPIADMAFFSNVTDLSSSLTFAVSIVFYFAYTFLGILVVYEIFQLIYNLLFAEGDNSSTFKLVRIHLLRAIYTALGMVLLLGINFFLINMLRLVGFNDGQNIFIGLFSTDGPRGGGNGGGPRGIGSPEAPPVEMPGINP